MNMRSLGFVGGVMLGCAGCSSSLDVTRTFTPAEAVSQEGGRFTPVAVERGGGIAPVPGNTHMEADQVFWPNDPGEYVHELAPGEVIQKDEAGRIVGVRSLDPDPVVTRFVPGTASSPVGVEEVRGRLADAATIIPLGSGDRVWMKGTFESDEHISGGGRIKTTRSMGLLVAGITLLFLSYAPSAYVGATSTLKTDRALLVPVAGPWLDIAERPKCVPPAGSEALPVNPCIVETISKAVIVAAGAVEGLGAILIAAGISSSTPVSYEGDKVVAQAPTLKVLPSFGFNGAGLRAVGTF
jgi:hypothetical protein